MTEPEAQSMRRHAGRPRQFEVGQVLDDLVDAFWAHGFADTSHDVMRSATGLSASSLYNTLGTKADIYAAAVRHDADAARSRRDAMQHVGVAMLYEWLDDVDLALAAGRRPSGALAIAGGGAVEPDTADQPFLELWDMITVALTEATTRKEIAPDRIQCRAAVIHSSYLGILSTARAEQHRTYARDLVAGLRQTIRNWHVIPVGTPVANGQWSQWSSPTPPNSAAAAG